jgi:hypothetical protein
VPQQRSSTAVWLALGLIIAAIACAGFGWQAVRAAPTPKGMSNGMYVLFFASLIGSLYFIVRLAFAGLMIVYGKPINRTVAWASAFGALLHCGIVLAVVVATIVLAPPQGFTLVAVGLALALVALYAMGQYPNLAETQGWDVPDPIAAAPRSTRAKTPTAPPARPAPVRPSVVAPVAAAPVVAAPIVVPPISVEAPRATGGDDREPSLLR